IGSAEDFYSNLNNWIPYGVLAPNDPLKNPPTTIVEISFHIFLDDNGGNCAYLDNNQGKSSLIGAFNLMNQIYAGYAEHENNYQKGSSNPVLGLMELPDCNTKIQFSLGNNNERIYFYNNSSLNTHGSPANNFYNFLQDSFPERNTKMNIYFTAGSYENASGYANGAYNDLSANNYVVICQANKLIGDYIFGSLLAHEIAHNLGLEHTYCGGGADVVCCSGSCGQGCTKTTNTSEYLSDIFGPITNSTCPHIVSWVNPFDNTIPNASKITNNVMGGSAVQRYFSPMQAGQMHRTLALKSTRKYVKKETYSPTPLVINSSEVWDFNLKLYRDITISSGAILTIANIFEAPYNGMITVNNGASLIIEKTLKLSESNKLIVKSGCNLTVKSGGTLTLKDPTVFFVEPGATFTVEPGGIIN
ncbi:MAG: M12 family metallo-peptidase, partial [Tannerellaceae bacterium]|nr:M12 family metallo-peptidase [Tannerellaceae bacterium]